MKSPGGLTKTANREATVRASYDTVAAEYAKRIYSELKHKPFDRGLINLLSERVTSVASAIWAAVQATSPGICEIAASRCSV